MSYRRNDPPWNILLVGVLVAGLAAILTTACCGPERSRAPTEGAAPAPGGQALATAAKLRFDPEKEEHSDLAVVETVVETIALRSATPVDWKRVELLSSCDCLTARFADTSDPKSAAVEITFHSDKVEEIDGAVIAKELSAKPGQGETLATYTARIVTRRIPFVMPRSVVLAKGSSGRFDLIVGQTFARDVKPPITIFEDVHYDEAKLALLDCADLGPVTTEEQLLLQTKITLELPESARAAPFTTTVKLQFGVPAVERAVEVRWQ